jgi:hypothetical protein
LLLVALTAGPPVRDALQAAAPVAPAASEHVIDALDTKTMSPLKLALYRLEKTVCAIVEKLKAVNKTAVMVRRIKFIGIFITNICQL